MFKHAKLKNRLFNLGHYLTGGGFYALIVIIGVQLFIPDNFYSYRDDGLISFSHAINFFKFGFYGVSPSGGLVEGVSTPALAIVHLIAVGLFGATYTGFADFIGVFSLLCFGAMLFWKASANQPKYYGYVFMLAAAILSVAAIKNITWHLAGLENPLSNLFIPFSIIVLWHYVKTGKLLLINSLVIGFAILTRAEAIMYILPIALLAYFMRQYGTKCQFNIKAFLQFFVTIIALPIAVHLIRFAYFNHFFPDSAAAQDISVSQNLIKLLSFNKDFFFKAYDLSVINLKENFGFLILPFLILVLGAYKINLKTIEYRFVLFAVVVVWTLYFTHPFIFHATRLDPARYVSPVFQVVITGFAFFVPLVTASALKQRAFSFVFSLTMFFVAFVAYKSITPPQNVCCPKGAFSFTLSKFNQFKNNQNIFRPTVSNPDLGLISEAKMFNILDIGLLGSPEMGILNPNKTLFDFYLFAMRTPDIVEVHQYWRDRDVIVFSNPDLFQQYQPEFFTQPNQNFVNTPYVTGYINFNAGYLRRKAILKDAKSHERLFLNTLQRAIANGNISKFPALITQEITQALAQGKRGVQLCYIANQVFRFVPELRKAAMLQPTIKVFAQHRQHDFGYSTVLLASYRNRNWDKELKAITELMWFDFNFGVTTPQTINQSVAEPLEIQNGTLYKGKTGWLWACTKQQAKNIKRFEVSFTVSDRHNIHRYRNRQSTWLLQPKQLLGKQVADSCFYYLPAPHLATAQSLNVVVE